MNEYKFLKSIDDNQRHKQKNPDLCDQDNEILVKLKKRGLIDYIPVYLNNRHPGIVDYQITKEGMEYVENHQEKVKDTIVKFVIPVITFFLGLLSHYLLDLMK